MNLGDEFVSLFWEPLLRAVMTEGPSSKLTIGFAKGQGAQLVGVGVGGASCKQLLALYNF